MTTEYTVFNIRMGVQRHFMGDQVVHRIDVPVDEAGTPLVGWIGESYCKIAYHIVDWKPKRPSLKVCGRCENVNHWREVMTLETADGLGKHFIALVA